LAVAVLAVADKMNARDIVGRDTPTIRTSEKLLLSVDEAAAMSSVSAVHIRAASREGQLPARRIGRGFKIRPEDLRAWINRFFDEPTPRTHKATNTPRPNPFAVNIRSKPVGLKHCIG